MRQNKINSHLPRDIYLQKKPFIGVFIGPLVKNFLEDLLRGLG